MPKIGKHQSFTGLSNAVVDAMTDGNNTFQIFTRNNRNCKGRAFLPEDIAQFNNMLDKSGIDDFVVHAPYVMNPASCDPEKLSRAKDIIRTDLQLLNRLHGNCHYVLHPGASTEYDVSESVQTLIDLLHELAPDMGKVHIAVETMAGQGTQLMSDFSQIGWLLQACHDIPMFEMCVDTCHIFAAGIPVKNLVACFDIFESKDRIGVIHVNDSMKGFGSRVDRHANVLSGCMHETFLEYLNVLHEYVPAAPIILETPEVGLDNDVIFVRQYLDK